MTKSDLIERLVAGQIHLPSRDIETSVNAVLEYMSNSLVDGDRIEIRGFGSIGLRFRAPRTGRNPKTGESVSVPGKYVPHFKPCLLYTSPSPRDATLSRMPSSA